MEPTSRAQYDAYERRVPPELEQVADDVWSVGLPMGIQFQPHYSLHYLLRDGDGGYHLIDTGLDNDDCWDRLGAALDELGVGFRGLRTIIATHHHAEHFDLGVRLRDASGARLVLHAADQRDLDPVRRLTADRIAETFARWGVPDDAAEALIPAAAASVARKHDVPPEPDLVVESGDLLPIPGFELRVIDTPGHTPGHMSFHDADRELLYTGDLVLPNQYPGFGLGAGVAETNPLADFLGSLHRIPTDAEALPAHGYRFRGLAPRVEAIAAHHLRRSREVAAELERDPELSTWELASRLSWTKGWDALSGFFLYVALRQTDIHRDYVAAGGSLEF